MFTLTHIVIALLAISLIVNYRLSKKIVDLKALLINNRNMWIRIRDDRDEIREECEYLKSQTIKEALLQALSTIDNTHSTYTTEDEANRELTSCLNAMGHSAVYHQILNNGRTTDILVDGVAIVEGKLDPSQADIDRLIGQTQDYISTSYPIYIVIYGNISDGLINRINNQLINKHPDQISLVRLNNANRLRNNKLSRDILIKVEDN
jgi:hypothetical protein